MERIRYQTTENGLRSARIYQVNNKSLRVHIKSDNSFSIIDIVTGNVEAEGVTPNLHSAKKEVRMCLATLGVALERETRKGKSSVLTT